MGEKLGPSPEQSNLKFENLRLFGVPFGAESVDEEFGEKEQNAKVAFEVDGIPFALHVRKVEKMENGRVSDIQFHFRITQEAQSGNLVTAYVEFEPNKFPGGQGAIAASIKREKGSLPKGFGMAFYGKMIDFMQDQVNAYQKPFKGVVTHATDMGNVARGVG